MIQQSTNNRQDLTGYIRKTWDDPGWRSSTIAGKIYRHYINLNAGFKGRSDTLKLFELGEEAAMIAYEQAMDSLIQLPERANLMMHFQYAGFKESHEIIKLWVATKKDKIKHSGTIETLGKLKFFLN